MKFNIEVYEKENGEVPFDVFVAQLTPKSEIDKAKEYKEDWLRRYGNEV